jgi:putative oxidoreductase
VTVIMRGDLYSSVTITGRKSLPTMGVRDIALLASRAVLGGYLAAHGAQKLFGTFGGRGIEPTAAAFEGLGLRPGRVTAIALS